MRSAVEATAKGGSPQLTSYRRAIADVQAHCERTLGRRFQALPVWRQLAVLTRLAHAADERRPRRAV